ncbi:MAG: sigma-70 family RNA polymerase sigma factor [Blastocatellia bacterium]|nr:sigma-70 family RNA polymerase sigma factor [Blastocatellia bacterium]
MARGGRLDLQLLLEAARTGDAQAIELFWSEVAHVVCHYVNCRISNKADAEDVAQEVLLTIVQKLKHLPAHQFSGWLCHTIHHKVGDHIRRTTRAQQLFSPLSEAEFSIADGDRSRPDVIYETKVFELVMHWLWQRLSPDEQQCLSLLLAEHAERQSRLSVSGLSSATSYTRACRLRRKLKCTRNKVVLGNSQCNSMPRSMKRSA